MHVSYEAQIFLVLGCLTYRRPPLFDQFQDLVLYARISEGWPFREAANELVQKLFGTDLEVERIAAVFDAIVEELSLVSINVGVLGHVGACAYAES